MQELISTPANALYYAAFGAVIFGMTDRVSEGFGTYRGLMPLKQYIDHGRGARLGDTAGSPLVAHQDELDAFLLKYTLPDFHAARFEAGTTVRGVIGLDGGSTSSKAVLVDYTTGEVLYKAYRLSKGNPIQDTRDPRRHQGLRADQGATLECEGLRRHGLRRPTCSRSPWPPT
jgi:activator of 2-hydroxyglutaryl-CoA dehydratase